VPVGYGVERHDARLSHLRVEKSLRTIDAGSLIDKKCAYFKVPDYEWVMGGVTMISEHLGAMGRLGADRGLRGGILTSLVLSRHCWKDTTSFIEGRSYSKRW
jgi:hypothetical protein